VSCLALVFNFGERRSYVEKNKNILLERLKPRHHDGLYPGVDSRPSIAHFTDRHTEKVNQQVSTTLLTLFSGNDLTTAYQ
jgi:hypothetical protein